MMIDVSKDVEHIIDAAVHGGQFTSADEMVNELVRDYARRHPVRPSNPPLDANDGEDTPDPLLGLMRDDAELMDKIVVDAYRHRREVSMPAASQGSWSVSANPSAQPIR